MTLLRKKIAATIFAATLALLGIASAFVFSASALAWDNCPKGLVNDPYPGACSRYVDTNDDGICDLSQPEPAPVTTTTTTEPPQATTSTTTATTKDESTTTTTLAVATTTAGEPPTGDCPLGPCAGCGACLSLGSATSSLVVTDDDAGDDSAVLLASTSGDSGTTGGSTTDGGTSAALTATADATDAASTDAATGSTISETVKSSLLTGYNVSPIAIGFFLVYAISFALYKTKRIRMATHRKIWNVLLLATFLITGIFGLILTIQLDYQLPFRIPFNLLFWHVEAGVAMTLISLFHIGWHFNYYKCMFRNARKKVRAAKATTECFPVAQQERLVCEAREQRRAERELKRRDRQPDPRDGRRGMPNRPGLSTDS